MGLLKTLRFLLIFFLILGWVFSGWPQIGNFPPRTERVHAAVTVAEFQATSGGSTAASSIELVAPSGITAGELLLIIVGNEDSTNTQQFTDNVSGWTLIGESGNLTAAAHIAAYYRVATGGEGNVTVTAQSSDNIFGWYMRISGADTTSPIGVNNFTQSTGNADPHIIPEITTTTANNLVIYGLSFDGGDGDPFAVSGDGWVEQDEQEAGTGTTNGSGTWGTKTQATAGATGNATIDTNVSDGAAYFQLAIQEEAVFSRSTFTEVINGKDTWVLEITYGGDKARYEFHPARGVTPPSVLIKVDNGSGYDVHVNDIEYSLYFGDETKIWNSYNTRTVVTTGDNVYSGWDFSTDDEDGTLIFMLRIQLDDPKLPNSDYSLFTVAFPGDLSVVFPRIINNLPSNNVPNSTYNGIQAFELIFGGIPGRTSSCGNLFWSGVTSGQRVFVTKPDSNFAVNTDTLGVPGTTIIDFTVLPETALFTDLSQNIEDIQNLLCH